MINNFKDLKKKITSNEERDICRTLLKETGNQNIQEGNYWGDDYWGVDLKQNPNVGENHLGRLIMKIREELL